VCRGRVYRCRGFGHHSWVFVGSAGDLNEIDAAFDYQPDLLNDIGDRLGRSCIDAVHLDTDTKFLARRISDAPNNPENNFGSLLRSATELVSATV